MSGHDLDLQSVGQTNNNHSHLMIKSHSHLLDTAFAWVRRFRFTNPIEKIQPRFLIGVFRAEIVALLITSVVRTTLGKRED
ncbi:hypothetical protein [Xanthomonas arboricola]|uniref:hypothetical protein n=1 Tax=Xanthomonas arboricola TaxID=56448 RepID=UPI001649A8AC|nr:hypothetical protein [Xanthomonas arboricola]